jgi:hypothetical protein
MLPEAHYHLGRYYTRIERASDGRTAFDNTRSILEDAGALPRRRLAMLVDSYRRLGEYYYNTEEHIQAEQHYLAGIRHYERGKAEGALRPAERFGMLYAGLGDIYYYHSHEYDLALGQFRSAETEGYKTREVSYKKGYIRYRFGEYQEALNEFMNAAGSFSANRNLVYATANAHFQRGNLSVAEGYYTDLRESLRDQRSAIRTLLLDDDPSHRATIEYLIRTSNNLGVTLLRQAGRSGNPELSARGMVYLTESQELSENYGRDPETAGRSDAVGLAFLNLRHALYSGTEYEYQIYIDIPRDMETHSLR